MNAEINLDELLLAIRDLKFGIDEAKNLCFNGKVISCDRKLQSCQVKCANIMQYVAEIREININVDETDNKPPSSDG